jgi:ribosomal protein S18 acetylase RimI-like enzyme
LRKDVDVNNGINACVIEKLTVADVERGKTIRLAALADAPDAFASTLEEELDLPIQTWQERLANPNTVMFVAVVGSTDVGLVVGLPHWNGSGEAAIVSMWVAPDYRRAGVGTALIQAVITWANESGYTAARLEVADENIRATRLYQRMGFVPTGNVSTLPPPRNHITEHELTIRFR